MPSGILEGAKSIAQCCQKHQCFQESECLLVQPCSHNHLCSPFSGNRQTSQAISPPPSMLTFRSFDFLIWLLSRITRTPWGNQPETGYNMAHFLLPTLVMLRTRDIKHYIPTQILLVAYWAPKPIYVTQSSFAHMLKS